MKPSRIVAFIAASLVAIASVRWVAQPAHGQRHDLATATTSIHTALGVPTDDDPTDDTILDHGFYVCSYDAGRNAPNWCAWRLRAEDIGKAGRHQGAFMPDDMLPRGWYRVQHSDYSRTGYDRGHLVDSADRSATREANDSTFLMTNVLPQTPDLNRGPWLRLEEHCRQLTRERRTVYIVAGGVFDKTPARIGHGVAVPVAFYKVAVALPPGGGLDAVGDSKTTVAAVLMPNTTGISHDAWARYRVRVRDVERRTGYRMLGNVRADIRDRLENRNAD